MNVARLNFCLSHEDPEIIRKGLVSFTQQILEEHNAIASFGYNGRGLNLFKGVGSATTAGTGARAGTGTDVGAESESALNTSGNGVNLPEKVTGLLDAYIRSSPKLEGLFVLSPPSYIKEDVFQVAAVEAHATRWGSASVHSLPP